MPPEFGDDAERCDVRSRGDRGNERRRDAEAAEIPLRRYNAIELALIFGNGFDFGMDKAARQPSRAGDDRSGVFAGTDAAALVLREGFLFTSGYASHLAEQYGLKVFTALNETAARRHLDMHPEIVFMLADNRFPDLNGVERDGRGLALAEEYGIPTILVTGGPVYSDNNPLVKCVFAMNWAALEAATRWAVGVVLQQAVSEKDEQRLAISQFRVQRASIDLYRELARELPAPPGFQRYEAVDERYVRCLRSRLG